MAAQTAVAETDDDYSALKDVRIGLDRVEGPFSLCLWIYLSEPVCPPATIIQQMHPDIKGDIPFLVLNKEKKITLFPLLFLHEEAPRSPASWTNVPCLSAEIECPLTKWVHVGCEVATNFMRLYIDGVLVRETHLSHSAKNESYQDDLRRITLAGGGGGNKRLQGYVHDIRVLPKSSSIADHFVKNPPLELSIDSSCISEKHEIEEGDDGVWSVVGGKASCRRNFSLDVVLLDALGRSVHKDIELVASLVYADNGAPVEKPKEEAEAPLLTSYDGVELPSTDRPIKLLHGRASFKLKISQLSSKCDNRLFRVHFEPLDSPSTERYPFLEAFSRQIRCISRNRNSRTSSVLWKRPTSTAHQLDGPQSSGADEGSPETQHHNRDGHLQILSQRMSKYSPPPKRVKVGNEKSSIRIYANTVPEHLDNAYSSRCLTAKEDGNAFGVGLEGKPENLDRTDSIPSDSESVHARNSAFRGMADTRKPISDFSVFKYCLEGMDERALLLREIVATASDQDMADFAQQVSLYTGCFHHRHQILIAKGLVQEGIDTWNAIPRSNNQVLWKSAAREIEKKFMKISSCSCRGLSGQDMELLQGIARCQDKITRENFDTMWHWLYPIAFALSRDQIKAVWECTSPKWIEGLITKEEAEASITGPIGLQRPGTFVLRFPTSRSWPHPDSGSLVVTYVGADYALHHRMLSLDDRDSVYLTRHDKKYLRYSISAFKTRPSLFDLTGFELDRVFAYLDHGGRRLSR